MWLWDEVGGVPWYVKCCWLRIHGCRNVEMHYNRVPVGLHHLSVLLTGFADGCEMRGSSTLVLETTPVFPGSRTIYLRNLWHIPVHRWNFQKSSRIFVHNFSTWGAASPPPNSYEFLIFNQTSTRGHFDQVSFRSSSYIIRSYKMRNAADVQITQVVILGHP